MNRARRAPGNAFFLFGLAALLVSPAVRPGRATAGEDPPTPPGVALEDSLDLADSFAVADSVAAAFADSLAFADTLALADSLALADTLAPMRRADRRGPDRRTLRLELGASADITNERFYENESDSTFRVLSRKTITAPETRYAGVLFAGLEGTRGRRATRYELDNHLSLGDKVQRGASYLYWRSEPSPRWMFVIAPRLEARHDRTFGRDLSEWRGGATSRLRRSFGSSGNDVELGLAGDLVRAAGSGAEFVPDRDAAAASLAIGHAGAWDDGRAGVALTARSYPDSAARNHRELGFEARWRHAFEAGHWLALEGGAVRRRTVLPAPTTRDNLDEARIALEGDAHAGLAWSLIGRFEGEGLRFKIPDSTLYFDQTLLRGWLAPRYAPGPLTSLAAGLRVELLRSPIDPAEEYDDLGGAIELESFGHGAWWRLVPEAGRRTYRHEAQRGRFDPVGLHTNYTFIQLDLLADQGLGAGLRLRLLLTGRLERHTDPGDDSRSLYFSLDLRRLLSPRPSGAPVTASVAHPGRPGF